MNAAGTIGRVTLGERIAAGRRERQVLPGLPGRMAAGAGGWERTWAVVSALAEGISVRSLAAASGLSPSPGAPARGQARTGCTAHGVRRAATA